jgi:hypothetical protein
VQKDSATKKTWNKPELKRIGDIEQVAGPGPVGPQGSNNKS